MSDRYGSIYRQPSRVWPVVYFVLEFLTLVAMYVGFVLFIVAVAAAVGPVR